MGGVKRFYEEHCEKWADDINRCYGLETNDEEVMKILMCEEDSGDEYSLNSELMEETYLDTDPRERMADEIAKSRVGMRMPCYGDGPDYSQEFGEKMDEWTRKSWS